VVFLTWRYEIVAHSSRADGRQLSYFCLHRRLGLASFRPTLRWTLERQRKVFEVAPDGHLWGVHEPGAGMLRVHPNKASASEAARKLAMANKPSQIVVKRGDGTVELEQSYGAHTVAPRGLAPNGVLSGLDKQHIIDQLRTRCPAPACPMCREQKWVLDANHVTQALSVLNHAPANMAGPTVRAVILTCTHCGFMSRHALGVLDTDAEGNK
jgi:hypothetical protein